MARPLTVRQQQVYDFIQDKISSRGYGPTVREIGESLGIRSPNGVMCHLRALERKGMISRLANKSRAIELTNRLTGGDPSVAPTPWSSAFSVRGCIDKRECNLFDAPQPFDVLGALHKTERYLLEYSGDDLRDYAIDDGDMLVVQPCGDGHSGDGHSGEAASDGLSLVEHSDGNIELKAASEVMADGLNRVIGIVVGVLRIHRPGPAIKPPHLLLRKAQRA